MTPKVAAGRILLEQGLELEPYFATFLMYSRSSEPYMLYRGLLRSGLPASTAQDMTLYFANHMNPGFREFARKLRGYVTKDSGKKLQEYIANGNNVEKLLEELYQV
jgi:hypothetical protein